MVRIHLRILWPNCRSHELNLKLTKDLSTDNSVRFQVTTIVLRRTATLKKLIGVENLAQLRRQSVGEFEIVCKSCSNLEGIIDDYSV